MTVVVWISEEAFASQLFFEDVCVFYFDLWIINVACQIQEADALTSVEVISNSEYIKIMWILQ